MLQPTIPGTLVVAMMDVVIERFGKRIILSSLRLLLLQLWYQHLCPMKRALTNAKVQGNTGLRRLYRKLSPLMTETWNISWRIWEGED
jgi:hypothetical protein